MNNIYTHNTAYRTFLIVLLLAVITPFSQAQYSIQSSETIGGNNQDQGRAMDLSDEGWSVIGASSSSTDLWVPSNQGGTDYWIVQRNADGDTIWSRTYGGFHNDDLNAIGIGDSHIAAFGTTRSTGGDVGNNPGVIGAWLFLTDFTGEPYISRVYAGSLGEQGVDMEVLPEGYALLVQSTSPELEGAINNGNFDYWVARVNGAGAVEWANFYGGTDADIPMSIKRVVGGFVVVGGSNSNNGQVSGNKGGFDYWVLKIDFDGNVEWAKTYGGSDDDIANDVVELPDGSFIVIGESESDDGDISSPYGNSDMWVIRIDSEGNLMWEKSFGGSGDDIGLQGLVMENGNLVITASTNSSDGQLLGNKGFTDAWVVYADVDGDIIQDMNYGGSKHDQLNAVVENADGSLTFCGTSDSRGANLPADPPDNQNVWLLDMDVVTEPCTENTPCFTEELTTGILNPVTNNSLLCTNSCNRGAALGPSTAPGCHNFFGRPTTWFKVRTDGDAEEMTISVSSNEFNSPQVAVMQSLDCNSFLRLDCEIGDNGFTQIINIDVEPDTAYYIAVADADGLTGDFVFCVQVVDRNFCNNRPELYATSTSMGSPLEGPYQPGEEVQICYEIPQWDKLACNGLQGVQPSFGPGWDSTNFQINGMPIQVDTMLTPIANGTWDWKNLGEVRYNFTNPSQGYQGGQGLPAGWYFTNLDDPPPNDGPDDTTGDIEGCLPDEATWKVCFTLKTVTECMSDMDCSVTVKSFADGEIGSNVDQSCQFDEPLTMDATLRCCINPFLSPIPNTTICSGDTVLRAFDSNLEFPVAYAWEVTETIGNVVGAEGGVGPLLEQQLFNFGTTPAQVTYTVFATSTGCAAPPLSFTVVIRTQPTAQMTLQNSVVCAGETSFVEFSFQGTPPFRARYSIAGILSEEFFFDEATGVAPIIMDQTALVNFAYFRDAQCEGSTQGSFIVDVMENAEIDTTALICHADTFYVGDEKFFVTGTYTSTISGGASNGCDSIVNVQLFVRPPSGVNLDMIICEGDSVVVGDKSYSTTGVYRDTLTNSVGCDSVVDLILFVSTEILDESSVIICPGESYNFRGTILTESGIYRDTVPATENCDSVFVLSLTALENMVLTQTEIVIDTGSSSGSISIEIGGGLPPYTYLWSTGDTTSNIEDLDAGEYAVTVTDFAGCIAEFNFVVTTSTHDPIPGVNSISLFPNPVSSGTPAFIEFTNERVSLKSLNIRLMDMAGRTLTSFTTAVNQGVNVIPLKTDDLPSQLALVVLTDSDTGASITRKLVID